MIKFSDNELFLITGASSGIGRSIAVKLNDLGASVIISGRKDFALNETRNLCKYPLKVFVEQKSLTDDIDSLDTWIRDLKDKYGKLHGMIYCAGINEIKPLQLIDETSSKKLFDINYFAPIMLAKGFSDRRNNSGKGSSMTFIASIAGVNSAKGQIIYSGSKAALIQSTHAISLEVASKGIRVNCISPSEIQTPMLQEIIEKNNFVPPTRNVFGQGQPEYVASFVTFLVSDEAKWITGQNYVLDGGYE